MTGLLPQLANSQPSERTTALRDAHIAARSMAQIASQPDSATGQLSDLLKSSFDLATRLIATDEDFCPAAANVETTFAIQSANDDAICFAVNSANVEITAGDASKTAFTISAAFSHWANFFTRPPPRFYQSVWGILRVHGDDEGVGVKGDHTAFSRYARIWRIVLDRLRDAVAGEQHVPTYVVPAEEMDDHLVGRYLWLNLPVWGKCKIFYETAGEGSTNLVFLHTAGADGRQNHSVMNDASMRKRCTMFTFDLPSHGRSYPAEKQPPQGYENGTEQYVAAIGIFIQALGLTDVIVTGASMGGHVCLAVAAQAKSYGIRGVIPLEGCDHLPFTQPAYEQGGGPREEVNNMILHPERVSGMIAPSTSEYYRRLIWWIYSSQGVGIFEGDLKFYFRGWDGRELIKSIDTTYCPVFMLTGEYDYSCKAEDSERTAQQIPGARFKMMKNLGHFPITESPKDFIPYLHEALDHIVGSW